MAKLIGILKPITGGTIYLLRFIIKHWYLFVLLLAILPPVINSISEAKETQNPSLPFIRLGLHLTNADRMIAEDVATLEENPADLIGMEKPDIGIWEKTKYYWKFFFNVIWNLLGKIFLITVPFVFFYKLFRIHGSKGLQSSKSADFVKAMIFGLILVFIINLIIVIHGLFNGSFLIEVPESMDFFQETWFIIKNTLPFHGVGKLINYLIMGL